VQYKRFVLGPLETKSYVVHDGHGEAVLVDPAAYDNGQMAYLKKQGLRVSAILITHSHVDHVYGAAEAASALQAPIYMHEAAEQLRGFYGESCTLLGYPKNELPRDYRPLGDVESVPVGAETLGVIRTPGHSSCGVSFLADGFLLTGDLLFQGSIGRYDLPGASLPALYHSLKKIKKLKGPLAVLPGHGPETTLETELRSNEYLMTVK
jgi:hydroxyacylglutathione hydrolase